MIPRYYRIGYLLARGWDVSNAIGIRRMRMNDVAIKAYRRGHYALSDRLIAIVYS